MNISLVTVTSNEQSNELNKNSELNKIIFLFIVHDTVRQTVSNVS